jgi:toxin YhaV
MVVNGWTLLFHEAIIGQLKNLADASARARNANAKNFRSNSNIKSWSKGPARCRETSCHP